MIWLFNFWIVPLFLILFKLSRLQLERYWAFKQIVLISYSALKHTHWACIGMVYYNKEPQFPISWPHRPPETWMCASLRFVLCENSPFLDNLLFFSKFNQKLKRNLFFEKTFFIKLFLKCWALLAAGPLGSRGSVTPLDGIFLSSMRALVQCSQIRYK